MAVIQKLAQFATSAFKIGCMSSEFNECFLDIGGGEAFLPVCFKQISENMKVCASDTYEVCHGMARCFKDSEKVGMSMAPKAISSYTNEKEEEKRKEKEKKKK